MFNAVKYHYPVHKLTIYGNIGINYIDEGSSSTTILFVHGLANYGNVWYQQIEFLKQHFRCIAIDLPGCGLSSRGDYPYSMLFFSEVIVKCCEALHLDEIILCGHSMGGHASIIASLRHPPLIRKMILIAPSGFELFTPSEISLFKGMLSFGNMFLSHQLQLMGSLQQSFYKMPPSGKKMIDDLLTILNADDAAQWRKMVDKCINGMLNEQVFHMLKFIQCPVLALFGNHDGLIPNIYMHPVTTTFQVASAACNEIHEAELVMIPESGHALFMERPEQVNAEILKFIES